MDMILASRDTWLSGNGGPPAPYGRLVIGVRRGVLSVWGGLEIEPGGKDNTS